MIGPTEQDAWKSERDETVAALRALCRDLDLDNSWSNELHLADVVEKYVRRSLEK